MGLSGRLSAPSAGEPAQQLVASPQQQVLLNDIEVSPDEFGFAKLQARTETVKWAFLCLLLTICFGFTTLTWLELSSKHVEAVREVFLALVTGEIGLIAGLMGGRD